MLMWILNLSFWQLIDLMWDLLRHDLGHDFVKEEPGERISKVRLSREQLFHEYLEQWKSDNIKQEE